jgi:hypothetical protein
MNADLQFTVTQNGQHISNKDAKHPFEYLSMFINLSELMKCDAYVCTLRSNYCRLLDEFRATIGEKPWADLADLSIETCGHPPCINGQNITNFDVRL